jgi:hypothetical protein
MKAMSRFLWMASMFSLACIFACTLAQAQDQANTQEDLAAPPPIPPKVAGEQIVPNVEIRKEEDKLIEEYSINGRIYMVKVTPDNGLPYYYMDEDGDGQLELQPGDEALNPVRPVYWKLKEWK